jgi:hypothetical protein
MSLGIQQGGRGECRGLGTVLGNKVSPGDWRHARARIDSKIDLLDFDWAKSEEVREARCPRMAWHDCHRHESMHLMPVKLRGMRA